MKYKEVRIAKGVMAGDVSPVAMFLYLLVSDICLYHHMISPFPVSLMKYSSFQENGKQL